jgi:hypothetical protein
VTCPDLSTIGDLDANLDPGESVTCTASYTVTQADVDAKGVTNIATASAGQVDSAAESATVTIAGAPTPRPTPRPTIPPTYAQADVGGGSPAAALTLPVIWLLLATAGVVVGSIVLRRPTKRRRTRRP